MNSLSLVIYLSDVLPSLRGGFFFLCGLFFFITVALSALLFGLNRTIHRVWVKELPDGRSGYTDKQYMEIKTPLPTHFTVLASFVLGLVCFFLLFIPSKETILLMAGSEFSEQVVNTPEAKELLEGVRQVIKSQLEQYTKKEQ